MLEDVMSQLDDIKYRLDRLNKTVGTLKDLAEATGEKVSWMKEVVTAGYVMTEAEVAETLAKTERGTQSYQRPHQVAPAPDAIVFGADMRELRNGVPAGEIDYPLLSTCVCGRQITRLMIGTDWEYCGA